LLSVAREINNQTPMLGIGVTFALDILVKNNLLLNYINIVLIMSKFLSKFKKIKLRNKKILNLLVIIFLLLLLTYAPYFQVNQAHAVVPLTEASVRLDRVGASEVFNTTTGYKILIVAKPASTATEARVKITYQDDTDTGFVINATATNHDTSTSGLPSTYQGESLIAWPTIQAEATSVTDNGNTTDVVFTSGDMTAGTLYGFYITCSSTTCVTNPTTGNAGQKTITITTQTSAPADIDTQSVAVDITTTDADQVTVTATVPPTFNFALSGNSIALGTLSTSAHTRGTITIDVDTNANNGYMTYIRSEGSAATLASASTSDAISSTDPSTDASAEDVAASTGAEAYVIDVGATAGSNPSGTLSVANEYDGGDDATANSSSTAGGVLGTSATANGGFEQFAQRTGVVDSDTLTLYAVVDISPVNKAATDYTDTWELVGAGNF